jgi:hypothetical protein
VAGRIAEAGLEALVARRSGEINTWGHAKVSGSPLRPDGLNPTQLDRLQEHAQRGQLIAPEKLLRNACEYLDEVRQAHQADTGVDLVVAEQIVHVLSRVVADWHTFTPAQQSWLRGALRYFAVSGDDLPDLQRGGFQDDLEVLNACLVFVRREDLLL